MAMHYSRNIVLAAYRAAHPRSLEPEEHVLERFDDSLREIYDAEITDQAAANDITLNDFSRGMLVFFAAQSPAVGYQTRVRHAVRFFLKVDPLGSFIA
jgi:hypothetical protein